MKKTIFSRIIRSTEYKVVAFLLLKIPNEAQVKKVAGKVGEQIDGILDKRYGNKRSEKLQERLIRIVDKFGYYLAIKLREDWEEK